MTKSSGLGDNFYIGGYDLSGDVASLDTISGARDVLEVTSIKQFAVQRIYGMKNGTMDFTTYFETTPTVSTPGSPTSGTPVVSTYSVPVYATLSGATVSNVTVNGTTVGTSLGTYTIPPFGTITITYTGTLTWNWFALGSEHSALIRFPSTDVVGSYFRGAAVGNASACINSKQTSYDFTRDATGNLTAQVALTGNLYGLEWGTQLTAGIRTDTAATAGSFYDNGAAFNYGAQAYLHIFALVGTSIDVAIQHATTSGGTYSNIIDFGSVASGSVPYAGRAAVSNTTTINEFLKVTTTGTFSFAEFAVMVNVNPVAGVVF